MTQPKRTAVSEPTEQRGRPLNALTLKLLNNPGKRFRVPWNTPKPDKTVRDYGYQFHYIKDPKHDDSVIFWIE